MRHVSGGHGTRHGNGKAERGQRSCIPEVLDRASEPDRSLVALDDALRQLEQLDPRKGKLIEMRYFGGMTAEETSEALSITVHTVRRELRLAKDWLSKQMAGRNSNARLVSANAS